MLFLFSQSLYNHYFRASASFLLLFFSLFYATTGYTIEYRLPQVIVLPVVDRNSIVMVRAIRPVIGDWPLELPAGGARHNETGQEAAARELAEETGIQISELGRFKALPGIANSPNRTPTCISIFQIHITRQEYASRARHDEEISAVMLLTFKTVQKMIISGEIYIGMPVAVLGRYLLEKR